MLRDLEPFLDPDDDTVAGESAAIGEAAPAG